MASDTILDHIVSLYPPSKTSQQICQYLSKETYNELYIYTGAVMDFYHLDKNVLSVLEDRFVNVTFGMSVSPACHQMNQSYRITVNTRTKSDSLEYDGTIVFWKNMCTYTYQTSTRCITPSGPAELYRKVNRSHVRIEWTWRDKDFRFGNFTSMRKELLLSVACKYNCQSWVLQTKLTYIPP